MLTYVMPYLEKRTLLVRISLVQYLLEQTFTMLSWKTLT